MPDRPTATAGRRRKTPAGTAGGGRAPTMADVAKLAGVSVTTVSFVVNDRPGTGLRPETTERVRAAIEDLGYRPNHQARSLALRSTRTIGFIDEGIGTPFGGRIISGAHSCARDNDSVLLILDAEEPAELAEAVAELLARQVDAIVVATQGTRVIDLPADITRVPVILVNCLARTGRIPCLVPDEVAGGRSAARLLLDAGHRDVAYLAGAKQAWATPLRVRGFRAELREAGVAVRGVPVLLGDYQAESGYQLCRDLFGRRPTTTAIFCGNDRMALGAYYALAELGLRVPEDVSVVGYDDQEELADAMRPALSTIKLPFHEMGRRAVEFIFDRDLARRPDQTVIECPPIPRASVTAPRLRTAVPPVSAVSESRACPA